MTLRDEHGEVEVGIGDLFEIKTGRVSASSPQLSAMVSVICPENIYSAESMIWVRLMSGVIELTDGKRYEVRQDGNEELRRPVLLFRPELVARLVREHRLMTFDIAPPVDPPARIEKKGPRAPTRKKGADKHGPTTESLFD